MSQIKRNNTNQKNASVYLRNQLKANYVTLPEVSPRIPIDRYFTLAKRLYEQAEKYYLRKESQYINAYIDYQKFLLLILDRIPKHPQYKQINTTKKNDGINENNLIESKLWIEGIRSKALKALEEIVAVMDKLEYERQESLAVENLEAEFEELENDLKTTVSAAAANPSLTRTLSVPIDADDRTRPTALQEIPNAIASLYGPTVPPVDIDDRTRPIALNEIPNTIASLYGPTVPLIDSTVDVPFPPSVPMLEEIGSAFTVSVEDKNTTLSETAVAPPTSGFSEPVAPPVASVGSTMMITDSDFELLTSFKSSSNLPAAPLFPSAPQPVFPPPSSLVSLSASAPSTLSAPSAPLVPSALSVLSAPSVSSVDEKSSSQLSKWNILKNPGDASLSEENLLSSTLPITPLVGGTSAYRLPEPLSQPQNLPVSSSNLIVSSVKNSVVAVPVAPTVVDPSHYTSTLTPPATSVVATISQPSALSSLNPEDIAIAKNLLSRTSSIISAPPPVTTIFNFPVNANQVFSFYRDDFHVSFAGFLLSVPVELQMSKAALEGNRCFFIHLGIAVGIHPFLLQTFFRYSAYNIMRKQSGQWFEDLLNSITKYCDLVDANALSFLWPKEFDGYYFCFLSGTLHHPIITTFKKKSNTPVEQLKEVLIHCDGNHFTLLRPRVSQGSTNQRGIKIITQIVALGKQNQCIVQENISQEIANISDEERSIEGIIKRLISS